MKSLNRMLTILAVLAVAASAAVACAQKPAQPAKKPKPPEFNDPTEAAKDPDLALQGEYLGEGKLAGGLEGRLGVQVVARSAGKFEAFVLKGGLPGEGWKRGGVRIRLEGQRDGQKVTLKGEKLSAQIEGGKLTLACAQDRAVFERVVRKSPTLGLKAPAGAVVLFDGGALSHFQKDAHKSSTNNLMAGTTTVDKFNDLTLHLEFRLSWMPSALGQARSNSGVYVHDCYEVQVLDSFGLTGENNECGGLYSLMAPAVNMCFPPMTWQTYDIQFTAPKYDASGNKKANSRITVRHNGVVIYDDVEFPKATPGRQKEGPGPRPIHLQGHGNKVEYRHIWVLEKK